jgi:hypothetical protein
LLVRARLVGLHPERHRAQAQARHRATASSQSSIVHTARLSGGVVDVRNRRRNECVELCNLIIADEPAPGFGAWDERPDDELLTSLAKVQAAVSQADAAVHDYVDVLRSRGISWTRIGAALGVSKQAAWERFSGED